MIYCNNKNIKECYVGGTNNLEQRMRNHKKSCNNLNNKEYNKPLYQFIRANGGFNNWSVNILEHYPCNNKQELLEREDHWILQFSNLLNCCRAKRSQKQYKIDNKDKIKQYNIDNADKIKQYKQQYRIDNADKIKQQQHQYYIDNKDKIKQYNQHYRKNNADKIKQQKQQYRKDNQDKLKQHQKQKFNCDCGGKYTKQNKLQHLKTKLHQNYINNII
jgi:hypothetical protein